MAKKRTRKTSFRKQYPSLFSLIKRGFRSLLAFIWFVLKHWFVILVAIFFLWFGYKMYSYLYERYLEDKYAYSAVQAERDADTRAVEKAANRDQDVIVYTDEDKEEVDWPVSDDVSPDFKPIWGRTEIVPLDFISSEVRARIQELEENVLRKQQLQ